MLMVRVLLWTSCRAVSACIYIALTFFLPEQFASLACLSSKFSGLKVYCLADKNLESHICWGSRDVRIGHVLPGSGTNCIRLRWHCLAVPCEGLLHPTK